MRRPHARLAAACVCAVATAIFTSTALADPGNGNSANAPGQVKQEQPTAQQPVAQQPVAPQQAPAQQSQAPGQAKKAAASSSSPAPAAKQSPGQAKKAQSSGATVQVGVKPSSTTKHWTHTTVGAAPNVSKRYGNGNTAAQIAKSRGAPDSQPLTGPGNSQPHKTYDCAHKNNKSGGVDVHAIKSYDTTSCQPKVQTQAPVAPATTPPVAPCGFTVVAQQSVLGVMHVNGKGKDVHLMTNPKSAHFQGKHADDHPVSGTTYSLQADSSQSCGEQTKSPQVQPVAPVTPVVPVAPVTPAAPAQSQSQVSAAQQSQASAAAPATAGNGGVLGAQTTLATPKPASHRGVLGTVTHVAGSSLPFTGFPVWAAFLAALALIGGGVLLRRRTADARI